MLTENEKIKNCLINDLFNFIHDIKTGKITDEEIYSYFSDILLDAKVDSKIIVNVLESEEFGKLGKNAARNIKINEGW